MYNLHPAKEQKFIDSVGANSYFLATLLIPQSLDPQKLVLNELDFILRYYNDLREEFADGVQLVKDHKASQIIHGYRLNSVLISVARLNHIFVFLIWERVFVVRTAACQEKGLRMKHVFWKCSFARN